YPYYGYSYLNGNLAFARFDWTGARTRYIATGAGPGGGPQVKVYDPATGQLKFSFYAYAVGFSGGVRVAAGDVTGDGLADIVTGAGPGGGPHVEVFDGKFPANWYTVANQRTQIFSTMAFAPDYSGGVFVAAGDLDGDGNAEVIVG